MAIRYYEQDVKAALKDKKKLNAFLTGLIMAKRQDVKTVNLTYIFCDDKYLLEINRRFLKHDTLTDIITFDMSESPSALDAEIYISVERIKENALKFATTYPHELHRVIFHGALHLCGYKDKKPEDKQTMTQQEDNCLKKYFAL